ncbi:CBS domain-containing protein [Streptomyces sp. MB22_4]|uniref:CBS domain-containing protein n=1 Tax=Streptomyces sp. MB22_4 TaxID=3383120 RepID=UPI0039A3AB70
MTVEVALAVMAGARVEYLTVCDGDDQSTGSISLVRLAVLRETSTYTDRVRLRDVLTGSLPSPGAPARGTGGYDRIPGVSACSR